jgi:hypothetical protein
MDMNLAVLIFLAILVVVLAYALGRYMGRRERSGEPGLPQAAPLSRLAPNLFPKSEEREEQAVVNWLLTQAFEQTGVKIAASDMAHQRIVEAARKALRELKTQSTATISLPFLTADASGPKHFEIHLTRDVIKELVRY